MFYKPSEHTKTQSLDAKLHKYKVEYKSIKFAIRIQFPTDLWQGSSHWSSQRAKGQKEDLPARWVLFVLLKMIHFSQKW